MNCLQVKKYEKKVRKIDVKVANKLWAAYPKNGPMWLAVQMRFDFSVNTNHDFLNRFCVPNFEAAPQKIGNLLELRAQ